MTATATTAEPPAAPVPAPPTALGPALQRLGAIEAEMSALLKSSQRFNRSIGWLTSSMRKQVPSAGWRLATARYISQATRR